jgi:hypothetical protein
MIVAWKVFVNENFAKICVFFSSDGFSSLQVFKQLIYAKKNEV